jgi:hypothetical protein
MAVSTKFNKNGTIKIESYASVKNWNGWNWKGFSQNAKDAQELAKAYSLGRFEVTRITKSGDRQYDIWQYKGI